MMGEFFSGSGCQWMLRQWKKLCFNLVEMNLISYSSMLIIRSVHTNDIIAKCIWSLHNKQSSQTALLYLSLPIKLFIRERPCLGLQGACVFERAGAVMCVQDMCLCVKGCLQVHICANKCKCVCTCSTLVCMGMTLCVGAWGSVCTSCTFAYSPHYSRFVALWAGIQICFCQG